jgi:transcriptional regulator with XRE-family HTH domain
MEPCSLATVKVLFKCLDMPRKTPMPKTEREICGRLRWFREQTGLSQVKFAKALGLDSSMLAAYEHCRSPLKYVVAWNCYFHFRLNLHWLASGKGKPVARFHVPSPSDLGIDANSLFSETFKAHIQEYLHLHRETFSQGFTMGFAPNVEGRANALDYLAEEAAEWFLQIPMDKVNEFLNSVTQHAATLLKSYPKPSKETLAQRKREMDAVMVRMKVRRQMEGLSETPDHG